MKHYSPWWHRLLVGLTVVIVLLGCARPPAEEVDAAKAAYKLALEAEADTYAPERLELAKTALKRTTVNMERKKYNEAREASISAKTEAEAAVAAAQARKKELKAQVETETAQLQSDLGRVRDILAASPNVSNDTRTSLSSRLDDLELVLSHQSLPAGGTNYVKSLADCQEWKATLAQLETEIVDANNQTAVRHQKATKKKAIKKRKARGGK